MNLFTEQKHTHRHTNKFRVAKAEGERDKLGVWDSQIYTAAAAAAKSLQSRPTL